jgi:hypothetical protein
LLLWQEHPWQKEGAIRSEPIQKIHSVHFAGVSSTQSRSPAGRFRMPPDPGQQKIWRQIVKIHGITRTQEGELFLQCLREGKDVSHLTHK